MAALRRTEVVRGSGDPKKDGSTEWEELMFPSKRSDRGKRSRKRGWKTWTGSSFTQLATACRCSLHRNKTQFRSYHFTETKHNFGAFRFRKTKHNFGAFHQVRNTTVPGAGWWKPLPKTQTSAMRKTDGDDENTDERSSNMTSPMLKGRFRHGGVSGEPHRRHRN